MFKMGDQLEESETFHQVVVCEFFNPTLVDRQLIVPAT